MSMTVTVDETRVTVTMATIGPQGPTGPGLGSASAPIYLIDNNAELHTDATLTVTGGELSASPAIADANTYTDGKSIAATAPITATGTLGTGVTVAANATAADTPLYLVQRDSEGAFATAAVNLDAAATVTPVVGTLRWDATRETAAIHLNAAVTLQVGQELHFYVRNTTATTIPDGTIVMATGVNADRITVAPATNNGTTDPKYFLGVATQDIAANTNGFVTWFGEIHSLDTSAWAVGTELYISATGTFTSTQPTAPRHRAPIAYVTKRNPATGIVLVRFSNGSTLGGTDSNVQFGTLNTGDLLVYNATSGIWENKAQSTLNIAPAQVTGTAVITTDSRLSDARTPTAHAASHAAAGSDALTLAQSQVTNLTTDLAAKAPLASPTFTGDPKAPTPAAGDNDTSIATTAFVTGAVAAASAAQTAAVSVSETQLVQFAASQSVLDNVPARVHPAESLLKQAVWWVDAAHSSASGQTVKNLGWGGSALDATCGSTGSADSNDPKFLSWDGRNYVYNPGPGGSNTLYLPSSGVAIPTGGIDIRFYGALDSWNTGFGQSLIAQRGSAGRTFQLFINSTGYPTLYWSTNGTSDTNTATATVATGFAAGTASWIRATLSVASPYAVKFYTSTDGVTWTQLGTTITGAGATSIASGVAANINITTNSDTGEQTACKVYRAQILNGIDGTPVLDVDTSVISSGSATSFTALTGQTVTINRSTSGRKAVAVTHPLWLLGTDDYMSVADNDLLDFGASDSFTVLAVWRPWATVANDTVLSKAPGDGSTMTGYLLYTNSLGQMSNRFGDGTNRQIPGDGTALTMGGLTTMGLIRNTGNDTRASFLNGTIVGSDTDTTTGTLANSLPLVIGRMSGATQYADMEFIAAAIFRRALSASEITTLNSYFNGRIGG